MLAVAVVPLLTNTLVVHREVNEVAAAPAAAPITAPSNSIPLLPFTTDSSDKQQDYFAGGIAEDLLNLLTGVQRRAAAPGRVGLRVRDRLFQ